MLGELVTVDEIRRINNMNRLGRGLKEDGYYLKVFIMNDEANNSSPTEGGPYKIATRALERIGSTIIGRPFIVHPDGSKHVRGSSNANEIIRLQEKWAVGEFVRHIVDPLKATVHGIVEIFPEFVEEVKKGIVRGKPMPKYVSHAVEVFKEQGGEIVDGRLLHVQAVDSPGYRPEIAKIVGTCEGMLSECSNKLRTMASSGTLRAWQENLSMDSPLPSAAQTQQQTEEVSEAEKREIKDEVISQLRERLNPKVPEESWREGMWSEAGGASSMKGAAGSESETDRLVKSFDSIKDIRLVDLVDSLEAAAISFDDVLASSGSEEDDFERWKARREDARRNDALVEAFDDVQKFNI